MSKAKLSLIVLLTLTLFTAVTVVEAVQVGTIRIEPALPIQSQTPATFSIDVQPSADPTYDPHIFLVMTKASFLDLTGPITVTWSGASSPLILSPDLDPAGPWHEADAPGFAPPDATSGARYTIALLKSHLDTSDPVYWAFAPILDSDLTQTAQQITVTLPSESPRMLVYILGKSPDAVLFDRNVPPTIPGFMIPELPAGTIMALASTLIAIALYTLIQRKSIV